MHCSQVSRLSRSLPPCKGRGDEPAINHLVEVANLLAAATDGADDAERVVAACCGGNAFLDDAFDAAVAAARSTL